MQTFKILFLAAFIATVCATAAQAEIPIIQADTVFQGFGGGSVSGIVFGPTGETVLLMHDAQPVEINIKTHQIVREFEKVPNGNGEQPLLYLDKARNYIGGTFYSTNFFGEQNISGGIIWDLNTGKIVKALPHKVLLTDGIHYYTYIKNQSQLYLGRFDINTFKMVDSIYLPKGIPGAGGYAEWNEVGIIPNSNKVLVGVKRYYENQQGGKDYFLTELYVLDFDTKKYTKIPIPYEAGQYRSEIRQIVISETGRYCVAEVDIIGSGTTIFVYDQTFNFLYKLVEQDFVNMTDMKSNITNTIITTIDDDYLLFCLYNHNFNNYRMAFYNIPGKKVTKYLGFLGSGVYDKTSNRIALYGTILGLTGIYDVYALPVKEFPREIKPELVYSNNQLEYLSDTAFYSESQIYDISGKLIENIGSQLFVKGKNIISINQTLPTGVYLLSIKRGTEQSSYKFLVE